MATVPITPSISPGHPSRHRITVNDFHRMADVGILRRDERVELIDGQIIDMLPIGQLHAALVAVLAKAFHDAVGNSAIVWVQNPIVLDDTSEPQPDIALLEPREDYYSARSPQPSDVMLLVEVADTSLDHDLTAKVPRYASAGVREVWVIDAATRQTHRFRKPAEGTYADRDIVLPQSLLEYGRLSVVLAHLLPSAP